MISFWYYEEIDRFAVTKTTNRPDIGVVKSAALYTSIDYYRYIPVDGLSLTEIHKALHNAPREVCFELTQACNLMCPVCIANSSPQDPSYLTYEEFSEILKEIPPTIKRITLTGGEPTLLSDLFNFVHASSSNFEGVIIATNGLCPQKVYEAIKGLKNLTVTVSLQGNREIHNSFTGVPRAFDKAFQTIQLCVSGNCSHLVESVAAG